MFGMENVCFIPLTENTSSIFIHSSVIEMLHIAAIGGYTNQKLGNNF